MSHPSTINQYQYLTSLGGGYAPDGCKYINLVSQTINRRKNIYIYDYLYGQGLGPFERWFPKNVKVGTSEEWRAGC